MARKNRRRSGGQRSWPLFDDGLDPRSISNRRQPPRGGRKALQLCRQVQRALAYAFDECGDDSLVGLTVERVEPAPNASRLLVTLTAASEAGNSTALLAAVLARGGALRTAAAEAICRKRAPELLFRVSTGGADI